MKPTETKNIYFAGNINVFDGVLTCILSIMMRSEHPDNFTINVLTMDVHHLRDNYRPITDRQIQLLQDELNTFGDHNVIRKIDVTDFYMEYFSGCPNEGAYCSPYTLIRLFIDLLPEVPDKAIYLDADLMFNRDFDLIYDIDLEGYEYAAARDQYGKIFAGPNYINAGVLLLNLKYIQETKLLEKARKLIQTRKLPFADQSAILRSTTKKMMLPQIYNQQRRLTKNTVIRHFSKRLFYLPYPHIANVKQWEVDKIHKIFHYTQFDDILEEYSALIKSDLE